MVVGLGTYHLSRFQESACLALICVSVNVKVSEQDGCHSELSIPDVRAIGSEIRRSCMGQLSGFNSVVVNIETMITRENKPRPMAARFFDGILQ